MFVESKIKAFKMVIKLVEIGLIFMFLVPLLVVTGIIETNDEKYFETLQKYKTVILIFNPIMILAALIGLLEGVLY